MFQKSEVPQTMPARRSSRTDPGGGGDSLSSPSEKPKKDKKSHIPLMQSSKIISKQPTLPAVISAKKKTLAASASSSKMPAVTPINLKFGAKSAAATKFKGQNKEKQEESINVPVIDLDSDEELPQSKPPAIFSVGPKVGQKVASKSSSRQAREEPETAGKIEKEQLQSIRAQREETDWKSKFEATERKLAEKLAERKQLDTKIPNMIEEFTKCMANKDNLLMLSEQKLKETQAALDGKVKKIVEISKENESLIKKYDDLKKESNTKDEEVLALKKKLQEFLTKTDDQEEELRKMSKECSEKVKVITELEKMKPKMKVQQENLVKLEKQNTEQEEQIRKLNEQIKSQSGREHDYRRRLEKLEAERDDLDKTNLESTRRITVLEADLNLHLNLVEEKDEEIKLANERRDKMEDEIGTLQGCINKSENDLKIARESVANFATFKDRVEELKTKTIRQNDIIENQKVAIQKHLQAEELANSKTKSQQAIIEKQKVALQTHRQAEELANNKTKTQQVTIECQDAALQKHKAQIDEMAKAIQFQNQTICQARDSEAKLTADVNEKTDIIRKVEMENSRLERILTGKEKEVQSYKEKQEKLFIRINELEINHFNEKEIIVQLESEVTSLKEQLKNSVPCVSLETATKEYMKILERRKLEHVSHKLCSLAEDYSNFSQEEDPLSLQEEAMMEVDTINEEIEKEGVEEEKDEGKGKEKSIPDVNVTLEDIAEESVTAPADVVQDDVSYPNNLLTYLWPVSLVTKRDQVESLVEVDQQLDNQDLIHEKQVPTLKLSFPLKNPKYLLETLKRSPSTKRKSFESDEDGKPSKRGRYLAEVPTVLPITFDWPLVPFRAISNTRGGESYSEASIEVPQEALSEVGFSLHIVVEYVFNITPVRNRVLAI